MTASPVDTTTDLHAVNAAVRAERDAGLVREAVLAEELAARDATLAERNTAYSERIEHQAATIGVLKAMSASPGDAQPVFDLIVRRAQELCNGAVAALLEYDGQLVHFRSEYGALQHIVPDVLQAYKDQYPMAPTLTLNSHRALLQKRIIHVRDMDAEPEVNEAARVMGWGSEVQVPLLRGGESVGVMALASTQKGGFSDAQIELLKTFAEQAVIAITSAETYRALQTRTSDLQETLEYQTAIGDVLKVISRSAFDLQPVLDTVIETAARLCSAEMAGIARREGDLFRRAGQLGFPADITREMWGAIDFGNTVSGRAAREGRIIHVRNVADEPNYPEELIRIGKQRSSLGVPLLRGDEVIGVMLLARQRVEPFTDRQIELVSTFADQAVIAIENTRLITEQHEALQQQTATAEVLQVINASPGNLTPVFDAILEKAHSLCSAEHGSLYVADGDTFRGVALRGMSDAFADLVRQPFRLGPNHPVQRLVTGTPFAVVSDASDVDNPVIQNSLKLAGMRSALFVPLRKDRVLLGYIVASSPVRRVFTEKQVALLQNFAAQAVIAMENARLLTEQREALERQTATAEVLQVINASPGDLAPVFDAILERAMRLCHGVFGLLYTREGDQLHLMAHRGVPATFAEFREKHGLKPRPGGDLERAYNTRRPVHALDVDTDEVRKREGANRIVISELGGARTLLVAPLVKDDCAIGHISLYRKEVAAFTDKQVTLLQSFADHAVIAIENARLLNEIRQRQAELRVTFDNMGDGVVMFDAEHRLAAWNHNFQQLLDIPDAMLTERPGYADYLRLLARRGEFGTDDVEVELARRLEDTDRELRLERTRPDGRVVEVRRNAVPGGGFVLIYSDITERKRSEAEIRAARDAAEAAYRELKTAQANLIQAAKMASLGQLTAGIAHEIRNPLNFVNNFAALSVDLLSELKETAAPGFAVLTEKQRAEVDEVSAMLTSNLEKITEHGKRADGIVKAMLEHSRGSSGERRMVDLNALIEEALNLAYHGARAQDQTFNITLERDFGEGIAPIEVNPQDITRVFLNIFSNGFYAASRRAREGGDAGFVPTLKVTTIDAGEAVEIRVRDNGIGIPADIRDKLFQPFFTTKPTGEGTGLGLSITYDIVTQQHGGSITVDSEVGDYSDFTIQLPRKP